MARSAISQWSDLHVAVGVPGEDLRRAGEHQSLQAAVRTAPGTGCRVADGDRDREGQSHDKQILFLELVFQGKQP